MLSLRSLERAFDKLAHTDAGARVARQLAKYHGKPAEYVVDHLGRVLTPKQREILDLLDTPPYRVLARSANTQGKTFVAAAKCSHFYDTVRPSITLATAPTYVQVRDLLFKELRTIRGSADGFLPKDTRLQSSWNHFVHGFTAAKADAFQGRHGEHLGLVFDEATGVEAPFWGRAETMFESHGGHWWLATYNPNDSSSPAYQAEEGGGWHLVVLNALEHPNILAELRGEAPPIPAAIRLDTVIRRMGTDCEMVPAGAEDAADFEFPAGSGQFWRPLTPDFEAQILGRWPISPTTALFSPFTVERCLQAALGLNPDWQIAVGCDVARFGDDKTTIAVRCGPCLLRLEVHAKLNTTQIAERLRAVIGEVRAEIRPHVPATSIPVLIDDTGGYGAGVIDQADGYNFVGVNASATSIDPRYPNTRSAMWCGLAALAQAGALDLSRLPLNERLSVKQELTAARFWINQRGQRTIEPKSNIKERLRRSPDRADALCLAYYLAGDSG
jgi:hypothetical protein